MYCDGQVFYFSDVIVCNSDWLVCTLYVCAAMVRFFMNQTLPVKQIKIMVAVEKIGDLNPTVIQDILRRSLANSSIQARTTL